MSDSEDADARPRGGAGQFSRDLEQRFLSDEGGRGSGYVSDSEGETDSASGEVLPASQDIMRRKASGTGPKGVLEDYKEYLRRLEEDRHEAASKLVTEAKRMTLQGAANVEETEDQKFLSEYRAKRMQEMASSLTSRRPRFGELLSITRPQYVAAIDSEDRSVFVVVHLYKAHIPECQDMNTVLATMAKAYPFVKFRAIVANEASDSFSSDDGLPALLVYRGGELVANLVNIANDLDGQVDYHNVEAVLNRHGVLFASKEADSENEDGEDDN